MINISKIIKDDRTCKALTGQSVESFNLLLPQFEHALISSKSQNKNRKRAIGGGRKGRIPTVTDKLLFILIYLKVYPTFDLFGILTNRSRSKCCESVKALLPILEIALGRHLISLSRYINTFSSYLSQRFS